MAASPFALPGFVAGWMGIGVLAGLGLARRGHDRRTMLALGMGFGPIMLLVALDALRGREGEARPVVLDPGVALGGRLHVMVLVQGGTAAVVSVVASVEAIGAELATLTLARAVPYEWLEGEPADDVLHRAAAALTAARALMPVPGARLELHPGTPQAVARRFSSARRPSVVLFAVDDAVTPLGPDGGR